MQTAINLYTVRELDESIDEILERVASAGYDGVQFSGGLGGAAPEDVAATVEDLGLAVTPAHVGIEELEADMEGAHERYAQQLGVPGAVVPWIGPEQFSDATAIEETIDRLTALVADAEALQWPLAYHNHDNEFQRVDGEYALDQLLAGVPDLGFEIDVGWVATGGADPAEYIRRYADRIDTVHMKDMDTDAGAFREIGHGDVDMHACAEAAREADADWLVYEHDEPDDPAQSLETGASFLADL